MMHRDTGTVKKGLARLNWDYSADSDRSMERQSLHDIAIGVSLFLHVAFRVSFSKYDG